MNNIKRELVASNISILTTVSDIEYGIKKQILNQMHICASTCEDSLLVTKIAVLYFQYRRVNLSIIDINCNIFDGDYSEYAKMCLNAILNLRNKYDIDIDCVDLSPLETFINT